MKHPSLLPLLAIALLGLTATPHAAMAEPAPTAGAPSPAQALIADKPSPAKPADATAAATAPVAAAPADDDAPDSDAGKDDARVSIFHDSTLAAGEHATAVVSVLGSSSVSGPVDEAVVSVLGNTYVDSRVGQDVVSVFGNVELGPHADIGGDVVAVGGTLTRDPTAVIHGKVQNVVLFGNMGHLEWLHSWVQHCLLYARPLAFAPHLGWAWTLAFSFLAIYLFIALLFPAGINRCVHTMEAHPGRTVLAAMFTFLLKPIVFLLVVITVIGAILVPFIAFALFIAGLFGKAVALAWIGRRVIPNRDPEHPPLPVLAVLVGGLLALLLYVIPVFGFIAYKGLDILGLGIVVYTLILASRAARAAERASPAAAAPAVAPTPAAAAAPAETPAGASDAGPATAAPAPAPVPSQPEVTAATAERAGFWIRMAALLLDVVLVAIVCKSFNFSMHGVLLVLAGYGAVMWKLKGTTIGGVVCHLRIVRLDGRAIDWPTAIVRALGCFLSLAVAGLGFIWVVFDPERQSWHDKIAGTVVVRVPRGTPLV